MGKTKVQKIGFLVGIVAMLVIGFMPTPEGLSLVGQRVLAVTVLMVVFWITEAMPIPFTALLPIFLFPVMKSPAPRDRMTSRCSRTMPTPPATCWWAWASCPAPW